MATFGLAVLGDSDSAEIRDALVLCLNDADEDAREEAMLGLAERRDQRALSPVLIALRESAMTSRVVEAAYLLLGVQSEPDGWSGVDYSAALQEKFFTQV